MSFNLKESEISDNMLNVETVFLEASWNGSSWSMTSDARNPPGVTIETANTGPANPWFSGLPRGMFYCVTDITFICSSAAQASHFVGITNNISSAVDSGIQFADGRLRLNTRDSATNANLSSAGTLRVCLDIDRGRS